MERIPNFEIRGFIQNFNSLATVRDVNKYMNVPMAEANLPAGYSYKPYEQVGWPPIRHTDAAWQRAEWWIELEPRYRLTPELQLVLKADYVYNTAFDWDDGFAKSFAEAERRLNYNRRATDILREYYADYIDGPLQVRIGKQQVVWGRVDGRAILDMVHGWDYTRWPLPPSFNPHLPVEYLRIPKWMTNIQYFPGDFQFQFLWIPDFEPSYTNWWPYNRCFPWQHNPGVYDPLPWIPALGIQSQVRMEKLSKPAKNFHNSEIGFMAKVLKEGWDISIHYLWAWDNTPTTFYVLDQIPKPVPFPPSQIPEIHLTFQPRYTKVHKFGLGADKTWSMLGRQWAVKFEGRYLRNKYYQVEKDSWTPQNRGFVKADSLLTGLQIETYVLTNMGLILRWDHEQIFKYRGDLLNLAVGAKLKPSQDGIFFTVRKPIRATYDRLLLANLLAYLDNGQWRWEPVATYELTENFNLMVGGHFFWGAPNEIFGQFSRYKGIDFGVKWSF